MPSTWGCDAQIKALEVRIRAQHHLAALTAHVIDQSTLTNDPRNHSRYNKTTDTVVAISNLRPVNPQHEVTNTKLVITIIPLHI